MKKNFIILIIGILAIFLIPPFINLIVSISSPIGFITISEKEAWINLYGAITGGLLTLLGVGWTISYTNSTRKEDQINREKERNEEFEKRNIEVKHNLSAQYKPILDVTCHPDFITSKCKFGMSKHENIYMQNSICIAPGGNTVAKKSRLVIYLAITNIGRGEAINLRIESKIIDINGNNWSTIGYDYKNLYVSNAIGIIYYKNLSNEEWKEYESILLSNPVKIVFTITYYDLVKKKYLLNSTVCIKRFIHHTNEKGEVNNILVLNPYDTTIVNEIEELLN